MDCNFLSAKTYRIVDLELQIKKIVIFFINTFKHKLTLINRYTKLVHVTDFTFIIIFICYNLNCHEIREGRMRLFLEFAYTGWNDQIRRILKL